MDYTKLYKLSYQFERGTLQLEPSNDALTSNDWFALEQKLGTTTELSDLATQFLVITN